MPSTLDTWCLTIIHSNWSGIFLDCSGWKWLGMSLKCKLGLLILKQPFLRLWIASLIGALETQQNKLLNFSSTQTFSLVKRRNRIAVNNVITYDSHGAISTPIHRELSRLIASQEEEEEVWQHRTSAPIKFKRRRLSVSIAAFVINYASDNSGCRRSSSSCAAASTNYDTLDTVVMTLEKCFLISSAQQLFVFTFIVCTRWITVKIDNHFGWWYTH